MFVTSQGSAHGRFVRAVQRGNVNGAEMAAREMGHLHLPDAALPEWSPDGKRLAYRLEGDLAVAYRDGSGERRIAPNMGFVYDTPKWSPDGRWIASLRSRRPLIVVHPDGSGLRQLRAVPTDRGTWLAGWLPRMPTN
jgi:Tol biopolymer transport system component